MQYKSGQYRAFTVANYAFLGILALLCLLPMLYVLSVSFSDPDAVTRGVVGLFPVDFTTQSYRLILSMATFYRGLLNSLLRVVLGVAVNMLLMVITAYPLSKTSEQLPGRLLFVWLLIIPTLVGERFIIPTYLTIMRYGLIDKFGVLILLKALPAFNCIMVMNYMRNLPKEMTEAGMIDGAGQLGILFRIILPMSVPVLATVGMFCVVDQWNEWFDALVYLKNPMSWPVQSVLRSLLTSTRLDSSLLGQNRQDLMRFLNQQTLSSAFIILVSIPIICIYPFLQRFFIKGMVLGSVKE